MVFNLYDVRTDDLLNLASQQLVASSVKSTGLHGDWFIFAGPFWEKVLETITCSLFVLKTNNDILRETIGKHTPVIFHNHIVIDSIFKWSTHYFCYNCTIIPSSNVGNFGEVERLLR